MVTLEGSGPFRTLDAAEQQALRHIAQEKQIKAGAIVFREGGPGDGVYVVKQGRVQISTKIGEQERVFAEILPGDFFGEMAVLELKPRSATATAAEDSVVYYIPRDELLAMVGRSPRLALALLREISQRLRAFDQRYFQEVLQTERLAIVGRFARSIVHDLKNPLNVIGLTAEVAGMEKATPEMRQKASITIRKQVERVSELIGEILDFTQGSTSQYVLAVLDYGEFVQRLIEEVRAEIEVRGTQIRPFAPPNKVRLAFDPKRIRRVFINLLFNAAESMVSGGSIVLRFKVAGDEMVTEVEDSGRGIAEEIAPHLFEAFATFGKAHGTGLGLSICKRIVEDHHGRIWARNRPEGGAVFAFSLPVSK